MDVKKIYQGATVAPLDAVALIVRADGEVELAMPKDEELEPAGAAS